MRPVIFAMVLLIAPMHSSAAPTPNSATPKSAMRVVNPSSTEGCPPISNFHAQREGGQLGLQRLGDLPPADTYAAAYRRIQGCEVPILLRHGVNTDPAPRP